MSNFVKMRGFFLFVLLLINCTVSKGQIYKYIGLEDGLNNQKIYHIQKDRRGYMWFLTQEGIDRYDGKHIKHYNFSDDNMTLDSRIALNWLYMDNENVLWVIGQKGRIFRYDSQHDKFELAYVHPELIRNKSQAFLNYGYLDKNDRIWLCCKDSITWYDTHTGTVLNMSVPVDGEITTIEQTDGNHFFIGTGSGLFRAGIEEGKLKVIPDEALESIAPVHELYYHAVSKQLFVGNYKEGILIYDMGGTGKIISCQFPNHVEINQIAALNAHELLVATGGKGVYKLDVNTYMSEPYITADYSSYNGMNAVSRYGARQIGETGKVDFFYNEVWADEADFTNLKAILYENGVYGNYQLNTVFAAYMNYNKADNRGEFNTPGILLTDAVMFALGGSHLELGGDHMLCKEYFPNENLTMSEELKTAMVRYYDFLTSYQNLLRDGGTENSVSMNCTNGEMRLNSWPPQQGSVTTYAKQVGGKQVIHLLNFSQANSLSWRDVDGTMPEPALITKAALQMNLSAKVNKLWVASPDAHGGALQELAFTQENGVVSFTLPSLKYWTMIVAE